jgi:hypothetical protein
MIGMLMINPGIKVIMLNSALLMMQDWIDINPILHQMNSRTQRKLNVEMVENEASNTRNHLGSADQKHHLSNFSIGGEPDRPTTIPYTRNDVWKSYISNDPFDHHEINTYFARFFQLLNFEKFAEIKIPMFRSFLIKTSRQIFVGYFIDIFLNYNRM